LLQLEKLYQQLGVRLGSQSPRHRSQIENYVRNSPIKEPFEILSNINIKQIAKRAGLSVRDRF
jgi:hypothetical protein